MNPISRWLCTNNSKKLFVKIVYPGGRVELHDQPILAAELLNRNPKCCVAHPTIFRQPYAVVSPTTTLVLGQKYYIVPISIIKKLLLKQGSIQSNDQKQKFVKKDGEMDRSFRWFIRKNRNGEKVAKKGKNVCLQKKTGSGKKRTNEGFLQTSCDYWQPGLESITEE
ncbi:hypothetical protein CDL12_27418 [Handroanthus impetiginosus]|uniref:Uncharacterized protein n=1 Tax=Handroanthus impetiginosus TaxID=429701 RepID=A0A2G9G430_9LAMI|nr:hypothetical protein CDL12_27418 [Handroanthus impetiginosus]